MNLDELSVEEAGLRVGPTISSSALQPLRKRQRNSATERRKTYAALGVRLAKARETIDVFETAFTLKDDGGLYGKEIKGRVDAYQHHRCTSFA